MISVAAEGRVIPVRIIFRRILVAQAGVVFVIRHNVQINL